MTRCALRFSVVIPCFNASGTIAAALDSVLNQTERDLEVIVIDDCSGDQRETRRVVGKYSGHFPVSFLANDRNRNGAYSRNRGIDAASGQFVAFLDADDRWVPERLAKAQELINGQPDGNFAAYGQFEIVRGRPTGALLPRRRIRNGEMVGDYVFASGQLMQTSTFICPIGLAREVRFDETLTRHQDSDFMMRLQRAGARLEFQHFNCAYYHFGATDLRARIADGRISSAYCRDWMKAKAELMTPAAIAGYTLTVYARILFIEGQRGMALRATFGALWRIGVLNFLELFATKVYVAARSRIVKAQGVI